MLSTNTAPPHSEGKPDSPTLHPSSTILSSTSLSLYPPETWKKVLPTVQFPTPAVSVPPLPLFFPPFPPFRTKLKLLLRASCRTELILRRGVVDVVSASCPHFRFPISFTWNPVCDGADNNPYTSTAGCFAGRTLNDVSQGLTNTHSAAVQADREGAAMCV